jgi:hypothetical protein
MEVVLTRLRRACACSLLLLLLTACGLTVDNPAAWEDGSGTVTVAVTGPSQVTLGTQSQYTATVSGSSDTSVTWSVNGTRHDFRSRAL